jgi:hypothetical protein
MPEAGVLLRTVDAFDLCFVAIVTHLKKVICTRFPLGGLWKFAPCRRWLTPPRWRVPSVRWAPHFKVQNTMLAVAMSIAMVTAVGAVKPSQ